MNIKVYRKNEPNKFTTTTVKISIISDNNPPIFRDTSLAVNISDDTAIGTVFLTVKATDPDKVSLFFQGFFLLFLSATTLLHLLIYSHSFYIRIILSLSQETI